MVLESDFPLRIKFGALGFFSLNLVALELAADSLEIKNTDVCNCFWSIKIQTSVIDLNAAHAAF